jgi:hypothetical protein
VQALVPCRLRHSYWTERWLSMTARSSRALSGCEGGPRMSLLRCRSIWCLICWSWAGRTYGGNRCGNEGRRSRSWWRGRE